MISLKGVKLPALITYCGTRIYLRTKALRVTISNSDMISEDIAVYLSSNNFFFCLSAQLSVAFPSAKSGQKMHSPFLTVKIVKKTHTNK